VAPGIAILIAMLEHAAPWGITRQKAISMGYEIEFPAACESLKKMHRRGIRVLPGGDYGFAFTPHGENARDLEYFVKYLGFTPMEAILSATKYGGEIMLRGNELGQVKEGYLADLLLVDGDPLANIAILRDKTKLLAVMKDGAFVRKPDMVAARSRWSRTAA
jgi:imidazolonepropionase-like amidohydrolase